MRLVLALLGGEGGDSNITCSVPILDTFVSFAPKVSQNGFESPQT